MAKQEDSSRYSGYAYIDGRLEDIAGAATVLIGSESDLTALKAIVKPGAIAYTAGWDSVWQLDVDGTTWVPMIGGGE